MRTFATLIAIVSLLISGCTLVPKTQAENRAELNKLKGPEVGGVELTLKAQAEQESSEGNYKGASNSYSQLVDKAPNNMDYSLALAENLRKADDSDAALIVLDRVLKKNKDNAAALECKGLCLMNKGQFSDAGKVFGDVMKIDPKRWRTLNGIGILFAMKSRNEDAMAYYQAALNESPDNPSVLNNVALTLAMDKQYDRSLEAFNKARQHLKKNSPEQKNIDLNMALVYGITGKLDEAEQIASPHLSKVALYNNMGFYSYLAKNNDLAKGYLNMALTQSPVYYERAWKNLSALEGDDSSQDVNDIPERAASNAVADYGKAHKGHISQEDIQSAPQSSSVTIKTDDIPSSKSISK